MRRSAWEFWNHVFEEMGRAKHHGDTYRFRRMELTVESIDRARAKRIGLYAYKRLRKAV
jgi:hypothetical protein